MKNVDSSWSLLLKSKMITNKDIQWGQRALRVAKNSQSKHRVGALIVRGGRVLSAGFNITTNDPIFSGATLLSQHAETRALSRTKDPTGATIYVGRWRKNGSSGIAKPCDQCLEYISESGISRVVWSLDYSGFEEYVISRLKAKI